MQGAIQNSVFFIDGKGLATMWGVSPCENGTLDIKYMNQVRWESVTDKDVIRIVNAVKKHINPDLCKENIQYHVETLHDMQQETTEK